ncbi:MAG: CRISPR-associated endonuclease Cas1 [Desulfohalobiaceae bacterium]|nr:CRISPR-associated endonuclease Cas1 [Desulfohalobiaceae bacterium]
MERVYLLEDNTYLRKDGDNLVLTRGREKLEEIPLQNLKHLVLAGYTSLSGAVLNTLINRRVETVLLDSRFQFRARLHLDEHKHVQRRVAQYLKLSDPAFAAETAKQIVRSKLKNQARLLQLRGRQNTDETLLSLAAAVRTIGSSLKNFNSLEMLRGAEGHGGKLYFQGFGRMIRHPEFHFKERNRRPPLDPVNALLSFCYTLLTNEVLTAIKTAGLDPYLGSLHEPAYGRPSLACDLVEEWRTFLGDRLILGLINRGTIQPADFVYRSVTNTDFVDEEDLKQKRPVEMKPRTRKAFLQAYEEWMQRTVTDPVDNDQTSQRRLILRQVHRFRKHLLGESDAYEPFPWSGLR